MTVAEVRIAYRELRDRALVAAPQDHQYIRRLWSEWDNDLANFEPSTVVPLGAERLTESIRHPDLTADQLVEWLDAYPDGVRDRLPGGIMR